MTVSHCLDKFSRSMPNPLTGEGIKAALDKLQPCEHADCTTKDCRAVCREWAAVQYRAAQARGQ